MSVVSATADAVVSNSEETSDTQDSNCKKTDLENQRAEIFVVDGALIYNSEAFNNAKITKLIKKTTSLSKVKKNPKKAIAAKPKSKIYKPVIITTYYNSKPNSEKFSQNEKNKIIVSPSRIQTIGKALISVCQSVNKKLCFLIKQNFGYTNPLVKIYYFSGKYSVRPPTIFLS